MNTRDKIKALEPKIVEASSSFVVGEEYLIIFDGSEEKGTNYGIWKLTNKAVGKMEFQDENGATLSVPTYPDAIAPASGWMVIPEG